MLGTLERNRPYTPGAQLCRPVRAELIPAFTAAFVLGAAIRDRVIEFMLVVEDCDGDSTPRNPRHPDRAEGRGKSV